jgi:hypothetical protein
VLVCLLFSVRVLELKESRMFMRLGKRVKSPQFSSTISRKKRRSMLAF